MSSRIPLGRGYRLASSIADELRRNTTESLSITPVGSLRRYASDIGDVSLLSTVQGPDENEVLDAFSKLRSVRSVVDRGPSFVTVRTGTGDVTLHAADAARGGSALLWLTGSSAHVRRLAALAKDRRMTFADGRLVDAAGATVPSVTEEDVYARLGLPFIPPELREAGAEIDAALNGELPALLSDLHVRGDLHMHTDWSDGRDSVDDMVRASVELEYEYIAITDHSERSAAPRSLAASEVDRQRAEIDAARRQYPSIQVLQGVEVEILKDGSLDFDDQMLSRFDIVLASLHDHGGQSGAELTAKYLRAIESPFVDVITHPANRSPALYPGYDVDFDRVFEAAKQTGTALEVDGAPGHLDMDGSLSRRAADSGVTIVVDSDSHRTEALGRQMRFGIGTARRGWLEPRHVLNTKAVDEVRAFVARKRARVRP